MTPWNKNDKGSKPWATGLHRTASPEERKGQKKPTRPTAPEPQQAKRTMPWRDRSERNGPSIASKALGSSSAVEGAYNPFVPITNNQRLGVFICVAVYLGLILIAGLTITGVSAGILWLGLLIKQCVAFYPLFAWKDRLGWLHPLVLPSLWLFAMTATRNSSVYIFGLSEHIALPALRPEELTRLKLFHDLLIAIGTGFFILGFSIFKFRVPQLAIKSTAHTRIKYAVPFVLTTGALILWGREAGGLEGMLLLRGIAKADRATTELGPFLQVIAYAFPYAVLMYGASNPMAFKRPFFWGGMIFSMISIYLMTGSRGDGLFLLLMAFLINIKHDHRIPFVRLVFVGIFIIFAVGILGEFRKGQFGKDALNLDTIADLDSGEAFQIGIDTVVSRSTSASGALPILAKVPEEVPRLWGKSYLYFITAPFPKSLLPFEKPPPSGRLNADVFFKVDAGVPCGTVAEAFWNFGIPGVCLVFLIFGIMSAWFAQLFDVNYLHPAVVAFYIYFVFKADLNGTAWASWIHASFVMLLIWPVLFGWPRVKRWV